MYGRMILPITGVSVPRAALHVEDHAAPARRADQPLALPRVAEPERPAADAPRGHRRAVARTVGGSPARVRLANRALLVRLVARRARRVTRSRTTTLPNCSPLSRRSNAARPSVEREHAVDRRQQAAPRAARRRSRRTRRRCPSSIRGSTTDSRTAAARRSRPSGPTFRRRSRAVRAARARAATAPTSPGRRCRRRRPRRACPSARGSTRADVDRRCDSAPRPRPSPRPRASFSSLAETTHTRAPMLLADLQRRQRDAAADAPDQHVLARLHPRARDDHSPRRERRERETRPPARPRPSSESTRTFVAGHDDVLGDRPGKMLAEDADSAGRAAARRRDSTRTCGRSCRD